VPRIKFCDGRQFSALKSPSSQSSKTLSATLKKRQNNHKTLKQKMKISNKRAVILVSLEQ